jgi:hypothetical protein
MADSRAFVERQLALLGPQWGLKEQDEFSWIRCPYHNPNERTPSLRINLVDKVTDKGTFSVGSSKCYGCGIFVPSWKSLADKLQLDGMSPENSNDYGTIISDDLRRAVMDQKSIPPLDMSKMLPWNPNEDWRTVSGATMKAIGAKLMFDENPKVERMMVYLPCIVNGEHIGGIKANIKKKGKRNYFNTPGDWVKENGLYMFDYTKKMLRRGKLKTLMLVEGPRDTARSVQYQIPAVGILGTGNWSEGKAELILSLGVKRLIIGLDPDTPGKAAAAKVFASLKNDIAWIKRYPFPDGVDPGNMDDKTAAKIRSLLA